MSFHLKEKQENIQKILTELAEESINGKPIAVEGKKDIQALRDLGVLGTILTVKSGKSFAQALQDIEQTGANEIILLLDFDRRGKQDTQALKKNLECLKIKANLKFWHSLLAMTGHEIQSIESLPALLSTLEKKTTRY